MESWHDDPLLIQAFAERLRAGWEQACREAGEKMPVIFTAHSVPQRTIDGWRSVRIAGAGNRGVGCRRRFRRSGLEVCIPEPGNERRSVAWADRRRHDSRAEREGARGVFIQPIGFVCDHVEFLYDIDIAFRKFAEDHGMRLWRAESLNGSPTFAKAVAAVARLGSRMRRLRRNNPDMKKIGIIGGGITGLSAAFYLEKERAAGAPLEYRSDRSCRGGWAGRSYSERVDGCLVEAGPDSFLSEKPAAAVLCKELGIGEQPDRVERSSSQNLHRGKEPADRDARWPDVHGADEDPADGAVAAVLVGHEDSNGEGAIPSAAPDAERRDGGGDGGAALRRRRSSSDWPIRCWRECTAGIRASLSARAVLPRFVEMEEKYGSLSRAMLAARKRMKQVAKNTPPRPLFTSLIDGMQQLVDTLVPRLKAEWVRTGERVAAVSRNEQGWQVTTDRGSEHFDGLIFGTPANISGQLLAADECPTWRRPRSNAIQLVGDVRAWLCDGRSEESSARIRLSRSENRESPDAGLHIRSQQVLPPHSSR